MINSQFQIEKEGYLLEYLFISSDISLSRFLRNIVKINPKNGTHMYDVITYIGSVGDGASISHDFT